MPIQFPTLPYEIQELITKKMELISIAQMQNSSRLGRYFGSRYHPFMDVHELYILEDKITFRRTSKLNIELYTTAMKEKYNVSLCASGSVILDDNISTQKLLDVIKMAEDGWLSGRGSSFSINLKDKVLERDAFMKFLEVFNVTKFLCSHLPESYFKHPTMLQMKSIREEFPIEDKDFLALMAPVIDVKLSSNEMNQTLHHFFKQWLFKDRNIVNLNLKANFNTDAVNFDNAWKLEPKKIFFCLPAAVLWNRATHKSSIASHLKLDKITYLKHKQFYSLQNGSNFLYIVLSQYAMKAVAVADPKKLLLKNLGPDRPLSKLDYNCPKCSLIQCLCYL